MRPRLDPMTNVPAVRVSRVRIVNPQAETAGTVARIRGVGTTGDNLGLESSVAIFIDGV